MAKKVEDNLDRPLTTKEFEELRKAKIDPFFFSLFIYVIHPLKGKVKFLLYEYQKRVLYHFLNDQFNIILKFRQAGITELISMYCLWLAMFHPNKNIVIISIKDRVAKKVLRKIKYMYKNLPDHLKIPVVNGRTGEYGTATDMEFSNGSIISSVPTTEDAGRSEAVTLLVIDEAAIVRWANQIWAAAFPTLSTGGSAIVNSTPYGIGNWYHSQWVDAVANGNNFNAIRLKWHMHPERDINWYTKMANSLGKRRTAQEIDGDFLSSGFNVFDLDDIKAIEDLLIEQRVVETRFNGQLKIFEKAKKGTYYYIGADIATGRSQDYSAFSIMDRFGDEVACFKGKISVDRFADLLVEMGKKYNNAILAPEGNDIGLAVISLIQKQNYKNLYYSTKILRKKGKKRPETEEIPGWLTTSKNRPVIIDELEQDIRNEDVYIKDPYFVQEAYTFIYDASNRPVALGKGRKGKGDEDPDAQVFHDDSIMAKAITNFIRKGKHKSIMVAPQ
ncbi:MAG: hypothetical protein CL596_05325 [Alteromonas sp.]|nr:hypothetical protein [Alteromonas sp.]